MSLRAFSARLRGNRFLRRLSILSSGMVIGQTLLVVSTPLLTRLYTPEDFGLFSIFGTFVSIGVTMIALRYEFAIPLERDERDAAALTTAVGVTSLSLSLLLLLLLWIWGTPLAALLGVPELAPLLWLLPACLLLWGAGSGLSFWLIRKDAFRQNGTNRILHFGTQAAGQLLLGAASIGGAGLILGYAAGYLARFLHLCASIPKADFRGFSQPSLGEIGQVLRRHWRFPVFSASAASLQAASAMLPAVFIALLYGPAMAGLYALAQRVVGLPLRLLGESASHVFLGEIRRVDHDGMIRLFKWVTMLFAGLGALGMLPLLWAAPPLFAFVFGDAWREAGVIVQLLVPLYLTRFIVMPVSQTLTALNRQNVHLAASLLNMLALVGSFVLGYWLQLEALWTIGLFSVASTLTFLFYIGMAWRDLRRADWQKLRRAT